MSGDPSRSKASAMSRLTANLSTERGRAVMRKRLLSFLRRHGRMVGLVGSLLLLGLVVLLVPKRPGLGEVGEVFHAGLHAPPVAQEAPREPAAPPVAVVTEKAFVEHQVKAPPPVREMAADAGQNNGPPAPLHTVHPGAPLHGADIVDEKPTVFAGVDGKHLHGRIGYKPNGTPSWSPNPLPFRMTTAQKEVANTGYCFNTRVSDSLELDRPITDYNSKQCLVQEYDLHDLPRSSVVIVFHNENLSALLRSIHSVLNRSPPSLLQEVVIVDDNSNKTSHPWLQAELDEHLKYLPKTRIRRLETRHGLMMARVAGVEWSTGELVVFLDSHIECAVGWLEPLALRVKQNRKVIVVPFIHTIDFDNFEFQSGHLDVLGFSWSLGQTHPWRPRSDFEPMDSPVMAGGLFAADRAWFNELGGYDNEMRLYGGEEMEIGFKVWMCGGRLEVLPCSRVGHVFRSAKYWAHQVYKVPGEEIHRNKLRVAEVWMDDYKKIAKMAIPPLPKSLDIGPLHDQLAVREKLHCKSFKWFLDTIFPELWVPDLKNARHGGFENVGTHACMDTLGNKQSGVVGAYPCHYSHGTQAYLLDSQGLLRIAESDFKKCVQGPSSPSAHATIGSCDSGGEWKFDKEKGTMSQNGSCLTLKREATALSPFDLVAAPCEMGDANQVWRWV